MELWIGAIGLGFLYAFMTMGIFITFRVYDFPDITVDGSFTTGAAVAAVLITSGLDPVPAIAAGFLAAAVAGVVTALIHTRFNVNGLLAGILVMTGLYSVNLHIMGRSNIPLLNQTTLFTHLERFNPGLGAEIWTCICLAVLSAVIWLIVSLFFRTDFGIAMRMTGSNPSMAGANGVNVDRMKTFGIALANGFTGASGALVAQYQGFADIGMGIGTVVIGLASVIIGEAVLRSRSIYIKILSVFVGSVIFRLMIAFALYVGMNPIDMKLLTALFVLLTLVISKSVSGSRNWTSLQDLLLKRTGGQRKVVLSLTAAAVVLIAGYLGIRSIHQAPAVLSKVSKIGVFQLADNGLLNITRDSFLDEMKRIGYGEGKNCKILVENANGDLAAVNSILDKFLMEGVDVVVPISTACTQTTINRVKDRPVVFATVANPFIIKAGSSDTEHLPNVTGVYGWTPMDDTLRMVRKILPGKIRIGCIWDQAQSNSVFNSDLLRKAAEKEEGVTFMGANISSTSEVYEAALGLVNKGIDFFVLSPDNLVYSAFESVVKAAGMKKVPIAVSDVECLSKGALLAYGYDYSISGVQAAHLVDRILKGEDPAKIPFERYKKITLGINTRVAEQIGIQVPGEIMARATNLFGPAGETKKESGQVQVTPPAANAEKRLAIFLFNENSLLLQILDGVMDELKESGLLDKHNLRVDLKSAQNEFPMAQTIAQDIVRRGYDFLITISTPSLQAAANVNRKIPHVFGGVTDPYRMGVAKNETDHIPNITGVATFQPVESTIRVMRELLPNAKRIGIVWNPGEACSEACTYKARDAVKKYGFELVESNVAATNEVMDAVKAVVKKGVDLFFTSGDNTVLLALPSIAEVLKENRIPYFTNSPSDIERGAFVGLGADYYEVGRETGKLARQVIEGKDPKDIPIRNYVPESMGVNLELAQRYGISVSEEFLKKAEKVKR